MRVFSICLGLALLASCSKASRPQPDTGLQGLALSSLQPLTLLPGSRLVVNANALHGSIDVALLDDKEKSLSGWESTISGKDEVAIPVPFTRGDLSSLERSSVRIRFRLYNAQLFGFGVEAENE